VTAAISPGLLWFDDWARENPWLALPAVFLWEFILLSLSFALDVWTELRSRLVKRAADEAELWVGSFFLRYRRRYLENLIFQHRNFDIKGLSTQSTYTLDLDHVFVELDLSPIAPHQASADMLRKLPEALHKGRHIVWDFLEADAQNPAKLVVLGAPGSGKTTLLKHVALTFAAGRSPTPQLRARHNVPILLFLREHTAKILAQPSLPLSRLIAEFCEEKRDLNVAQGWFDRILAKGRCIVMFDGLDEVTDLQTRSKIIAWVESQMSIHAKNRFVVTSRPHGYRENPMAGVSVLEVRPFSWPQVRDFVHKWYVAIEVKAQHRDDQGVRIDAKHGANDLLGRLRLAPALADLAVNPLLSTMIANVHRFRSSLPGKRVELYAEICEVSLGKRHQSKGLSLDITPAQKQRVLEPLAWRMMSDEIREVSKDNASSVIASTLVLVSPETEPTQFLVTIENDSSLLLQHEGSVYAFAHPTFQEFLAACHARRQPDLVDVLVQNLGKGWWRECLRLFAATGNATAILQACMRNDPLDPEALALAIECREEAKEIDLNVREKLNDLVETGLDQMDPIKRRPVAEAMLKVRVGGMHRLDEDRYIDPGLVTHADYQLFLEEVRIKGEYRQPDHWTGMHYLVGQGLDPVIGLRFSDTHAFCAWLTEREGSPWRFRPPTNDENATIDPKWETHEIVPWRLDAANSNAASRAWPVSIKTRQSAFLKTVLHKLQPEILASALACALERARDRARARGRATARALILALDLARDLDRSLALDLARDLAGKLDPSRALARDRGGVLDPSRARDLARALNLDVDRARTLALDLASGLDHALLRARALDLARARARALDHTLALDLADALYSARARARDRDLERARDRDPARALARALERARDRARALAGALDFELALDHALGLADALDHALGLADALDPARDVADPLDHALDLADALDPARALSHARARALDLELAANPDLDRALDHALDRALNRALDLELPLDRAHEHALGHLVARVEMAKIVALLSERDIETKIDNQSPCKIYSFLHKYSFLMNILWFINNGKHMLNDATLAQTSHRMTTCYLLASFKNSRINGDDPPFEALRLVKERPGTTQN
jgi:hypothetical protein